MKRVAFLAFSSLLASPAFAADLDRPRYSERDVIIEREREAPPRVVEYHRYYDPAPVYAERVYEEPRYYAYDYRPYHDYAAWRPRHRFWHRGWHRHHAHRGW